MSESILLPCSFGPQRCLSILTLSSLLVKILYTRYLHPSGKAIVAFNTNAHANNFVQKASRSNLGGSMVATELVSLEETLRKNLRILFGLAESPFRPCLPSSALSLISKPTTTFNCVYVFQISPQKTISLLKPASESSSISLSKSLIHSHSGRLVLLRSLPSNMTSRRLARIMERYGLERDGLRYIEDWGLGMGLKGLNHVGRVTRERLPSVVGLEPL